MVGNPSDRFAVAINGAESALTYAPGRDYASATTLAVGQGGWVSASDPVSLTATGAAVDPGATPPASVPGPTASAAPSSTVNLQAAAVTSEDMRGLTKEEEGAGELAGLPGVTASYGATWADERPGTPVFVLDLSMATFATRADLDKAAGALVGSTLTDSTLTNQRPLGSQGVGDQDQAVAFQAQINGRRPITVDGYLLEFRRGNTLVAIITAQLAGTGAISVAAYYARIIDARLLAAAAR
jgi:hypothetical protein